MLKRKREEGFSGPPTATLVLKFQCYFNYCQEFNIGFAPFWLKFLESVWWHVNMNDKWLSLRYNNLCFGVSQMNKHGAHRFHCSVVKKLEHFVRQTFLLDVLTRGSVWEYCFKETGCIYIASSNYSMDPNTYRNLHWIYMCRTRMRKVNNGTEFRRVSRSELSVQWSRSNSNPTHFKKKSSSLF